MGAIHCGSLLGIDLFVNVSRLGIGYRRPYIESFLCVEDDEILYEGDAVIMNCVPDCQDRIFVL